MSIINPLNSSVLSTTSSTESQVSSQASSATVETTGNPFLDSLRLPTETVPEANNQDLTQEDFFSLLSQQLSMQDPFEPVDNDQMIQQMASFSTVDGISRLNDEIVNLNTVMTSSQALQASGLVGQKVLIPSNSSYISSESPSMKGVVSAPEPIADITVMVEDENGQLVANFVVDGSAGGNIDLDWDGLDTNGDPVPTGNYTFKASGKVSGESEDLPVSTYAHVTSVSLGSASTGAILNLRGMGGVLMSDVLAVAE